MSNLTNQSTDFDPSKWGEGINDLRNFKICD